MTAEVLVMKQSRTRNVKVCFVIANVVKQSRTVINFHHL